MSDLPGYLDLGLSKRPFPTLSSSCQTLLGKRYRYKKSFVQVPACLLMLMKAANLNGIITHIALNE